MTSSHQPTVDGNGLRSTSTMSATTLSERVIASRSARGMNASALQKESGLSARTIRDIESGNPTRRYSPTTLGRLDRPLGWKPGTAWGLWVEQSPTAGSAQLQRTISDLTRRLDQLEEEPPWARELIEVVRLLPPPDRDFVFALARRLGPR